MAEVREVQGSACGRALVGDSEDSWMEHFTGAVGAATVTIHE